MTIEKDIYIYFKTFIKSNSSWALLNKLHNQQRVFTKLHRSVVGIVKLVSAAIQTQDRNKRFCKLEVLTLDDEGDDKGWVAWGMSLQSGELVNRESRDGQESDRAQERMVRQSG